MSNAVKSMVELKELKAGSKFYLDVALNSKCAPFDIFIKTSTQDATDGTFICVNLRTGVSYHIDEDAIVTEVKIDITI